MGKKSGVVRVTRAQQRGETVEYFQGDERGTILILTHRPGHESVKTIVQTVPPER